MEPRDKQDALRLANRTIAEADRRLAAVSEILRKEKPATLRRIVHLLEPVENATPEAKGLAMLSAIAAAPMYLPALCADLVLSYVAIACAEDTRRRAGLGTDEAADEPNT